MSTLLNTGLEGTKNDAFHNCVDQDVLFSCYINLENAMVPGSSHFCAVSAEIMQVEN